MEEQIHTYVYALNLNRNKTKNFVINNLNVKLVQKKEQQSESSIQFGNEDFWFANYNGLDDMVFNMQSLQ